MIELLQENGEVVLVLGSGLNLFNAEIFSQADVAVAIEPSMPPISRDKRVPRNLMRNLTQQIGAPAGAVSRGPRPPSFVSRCTINKIDIAKTVNRMACSLSAPADIDIRLWVTLLKQARRMHGNSLLATYFGLAAQASLGVCIVASSLLQSPSFLTILPVLWVSWVVVPLLALPLLAGRPDQDIMKMISPKNLIKNEYTEPEATTCGGTTPVPRLVGYFAIRFVPTAIVSALLYSMCVADVTRDSLSATYTPIGSITSTTSEDGQDKPILVFPRVVALWFFVGYLILHSANFVHRSESWCEAPPHQINPLWCIAALFVAGLQTTYSVVVCLIYHEHVDLSKLSLSVYLLGFSWPFCLYVLDTLGKRDDGKKGYGRNTDDFGRELWLDFNTKLGMHSPV